MPSAPEYPPAVYLSYSSREWEQVLPIAERLRRRGIRVWLDRWEMSHGDTWEEKVQEAHRCPVWVVFLGARGMGPYHQYEVEQAAERARTVAARRTDTPYRMIPVLLPDWQESWNRTLPSLFREWLPVQFPSLDDEDSFAKLISIIQRGDGPSPSPAHLRILRGHRGPVLAVAFRPNGTAVASGGDDGTVRIWDLVSNEETRMATGHRGRVQTIAFSPDGRTLASGGRDNLVLIHDPGSGTLLRRLEERQPSVNALVFYQEDLLLSGGEDGRLIAWRTSLGQITRKGRFSANAINSLAYSRRGGVLAAAGQDETIRLLAPSDLSRRWSSKGSLGVLWSVAISPDEQLVAAVGGSGKVIICKAENGAIAHVLGKNSKPLLGVAFLPHGRQVASAGADGWIRIWEIASSAEVRQRQITAGWIYGIAVSPDGRWIAGATDDGIVLWDGKESGTFDPVPAEPHSKPSHSSLQPTTIPEFVRDSARFADVLARLVFCDRSLFRLCAQPDVDAVRCVLDAARDQPETFEERLAEATAGFVPHPLWKAWMVHIHGERMRQLGTELWSTQSIRSSGPAASSFAHRQPAEISSRGLGPSPGSVSTPIAAEVASYSSEGRSSATASPPREQPRRESPTPHRRKRK